MGKECAHIANVMHLRYILLNTASAKNLNGNIIQVALLKYLEKQYFCSKHSQENFIFYVQPTLEPTHSSLQLVFGTIFPEGTKGLTREAVL
jgi:hypothetical protein